MKANPCLDCGRPIIPTLKQQERGETPRICPCCIRLRKMERTLDKIWRKLSDPQN